MLNIHNQKRMQWKKAQAHERHLRIKARRAREEKLKAQKEFWKDPFKRFREIAKDIANAWDNFAKWAANKSCLVVKRINKIFGIKTDIECPKQQKKSKPKSLNPYFNGINIKAGLMKLYKV